MKLIIQRLYASAAIAVASFFDRGVENILGQFAAVDAKLDRFIAKQDAVIRGTAVVTGASFDRVRAVEDAEFALRTRAYQREDAARAGAARARRVRERIAKLLD